MEASPLIDALAAKQIQQGTPSAADAANYLSRFGGPAMKPVVWEQLSHWHKKFAESDVKQRVLTAPAKPEHQQLYGLDSRLTAAYTKAQGWTLSTEDEAKPKELLGDKEVAALVCTFACGSRESAGPAPGNYYIYGKLKLPVFPIDARIDYLMPTERCSSWVNQYKCRDLKSLEQKLLQFPPRSTFSVAHTGSTLDGWGDWTSIGEFLRNQCYSFNE